MKLPCLPHQNRLHDGLGIVVDHPFRHTAEEGKGPVMGIQHHFLGFPGIGHQEHLPTVAKPEMGQLHGLDDASQFHLLVTPVELAGLARGERQRDEGLCSSSRGLGLPLFHEALNAVIGPGIARLLQVLKEPLGTAPFPLGAQPILYEPALQLLGKGPQLRTGLLLPTISRPHIRLQVFLHGIARQIQVAGDGADRLPLHQVTPTQLGKTFHADHSRLLQPKKAGMMNQPGWSKFNADIPGCLVSFAR